MRLRASAWLPLSIHTSQRGSCPSSWSPSSSLEAAIVGYARLRHARAGRSPGNRPLAGLGLMVTVSPGSCSCRSPSPYGAALRRPIARARSPILTGVSARGGPSPIGANLLLTLRAFYDRGDLNLRHNLPGRPATDMLLGSRFLRVGWLTALWRIREPRYRLLLIWFGVMLLPTVLSIEAPHSLRGSGVLPPLALLCGLGATTLISAFPRISRRRVAASLLLLAVLVVSGGLTARDYFVPLGAVCASSTPPFRCRNSWPLRRRPASSGSGASDSRPPHLRSLVQPAADGVCPRPASPIRRWAPARPITRTGEVRLPPGRLLRCAPADVPARPGITGAQRSRRLNRCPTATLPALQGRFGRDASVGELAAPARQARLGHDL